MTTVVTKNAEVSKLIVAAGKLADSLYKTTVKAAEAAAAQLPTEGAIATRVEQVVLAYKDEFDAAGHNVKAIFKDALWLLAAPQTAISLEARVDGQKAEVQTTAEKAVGMAKHAMKEAAKQVREANGAGRAEGAGRKPKTAETVPTQVAAVPAGGDAEVAFAAWLHNMEVYIHDVSFAPRITGKLKELGFALRIIK